MRNQAVHYIDNKNAWNCYSEGTPIINDIKVDDQYLLSAIERTYEFAKAIEEGIADSIKGEKA